MTSMGATSRSCRPTRTGSMATATGRAARARKLLAAYADAAVRLWLAPKNMVSAQRWASGPLVGRRFETPALSERLDTGPYGK
jgi:hypothetical protein